MSYFRPAIDAMEGYTPGEQPADPSVIKLNTNENPYPPSPKVMTAIAAVPADKLRRYSDPFANAFRDEAAKLFGVTRDHVICGNGMDDVINMTVRAFSGPNEPMVYPVPTYTLYAVLARIHGAPVREVKWKSGGSAGGPSTANAAGSYDLPIDELVASDARVTYIVNPNSPTGTFVAVERIVELASRFRGVVCVDEAYVDFARESAMRLVHEHPNVLVMRTMSKGYSLAGMRFGFAIGRPELIAGLMKVKDSYPLDAIAIAAATAALSDQDYYRQTWQKVIAERERLAEALERMGLPSLPSQSNFLLASAGRHDARGLYESLKARRILVRYFNSPGLDDKLRITIGTREQNDALLAALKELTA